MKGVVWRETPDHKATIRANEWLVNNCFSKKVTGQRMRGSAAVLCRFGRARVAAYAPQFRPRQFGGIQSGRGLPHSKTQGRNSAHRPNALPTLEVKAFPGCARLGRIT